MPYEVSKSGSGYVVRKKGGGRVLGRHKSKTSAQRQMRAIYAEEGRRKGK